MHVDDMELVREFAANNSDDAFAGLVRRHVNLVYSVALRRLGSAQEAEEVTQVVFIILARKAASLRSGTVLSGWLYQTAQLTAANSQRAALRRQRREQEAFMELAEPSGPDPSWRRLGPLLEEAMSRLREKERDAVVLRFFENRSFAEVAAALGVQEAAAQKRVNRATEKLRQFFVRRGIQVSAVALLASIGAHAVQAAPSGLASAIAVAAPKATVAGGSTLTLIKTTLKIMAWTKAKTAIVTAATLVVAGVLTTAVVVQHRHGTDTPVPRTSWVFAGYATPEAAFQSAMWAISQGDMKAYLASLAPGGRLFNEAQHQTAEQMAAKARHEVERITGFRVVERKMISSDEAVLVIFAEGINESAGFRFQRIENEWKFAGPARDSRLGKQNR
jgi:RNA polymerase sigma factor (sigma-70 family)